MPKALLFPNHDSVLVGKNQSLEDGAYIARVNGASAGRWNVAPDGTSRLAEVVRLDRKVLQLSTIGSDP